MNPIKKIHQDYKERKITITQYIGLLQNPVLSELDCPKCQKKLWYSEPAFELEDELGIMPNHFRTHCDCGYIGATLKTDD